MIEIPESTVYYGETITEWIARNSKQRETTPEQRAAIDAALAPLMRGTSRKVEFKEEPSTTS